jgi:hypothetical protein
MLCRMLAAIPCFIAIGSARAADPAPIPEKGVKVLFVDDRPGPKILIRTGDSSVPAAPPNAGPGAAASGFDGPAVGGSGQITGPVPPGGPQPNFYYLQRDGVGLPTPPNLPDGAKVIIRRGPDGIPNPEPRAIATFRAPGAMWQDDPEMRRLLEQDANFDRESRELADEYRRAPKEKQNDVKGKLEEVVARQFEARQERRSLELKRLEDEIKRIQSSIDKRNAVKKQIVDRRVSEVLGQDDTSF